MSRIYDLTLKKEILTEEAADLLGSIYRAGDISEGKRRFGLYKEVFRYKQRILSAEDADAAESVGKELDRIRPRSFEGEASEVLAEDIIALDTGLIKKLEEESSKGHKGDRKAFILAGQPGAGKTLAASIAAEETEGNIFFISGDDYRRYHPIYSLPASERESMNVAGITSAFSGQVVEGLIGKLSDSGASLIIEGTGRTADVPMRTAGLLKSREYAVEVAVIAAKPLASEVSTMFRYLRMRQAGIPARETAKEHHDLVVKRLPENLDEIEKDSNIDRMRIWDREGNLIYDSKGGGKPSDALRSYWRSPFDDAEREHLLGYITEIEDAGLGSSRLSEIRKELEGKR